MSEMKKFFSAMVSLVALSCAAASAEEGPGSDFRPVPKACKWLDSKKIIFSYDGTYTDSTAFVYDASADKMIHGVSAPEKYTDFPVTIEGAVNMTFSPDSSKIAYTKDNDLYFYDISAQKETRLTFDGTDLILNGYASWVYYEEIFGRPSRYRAFWWSGDSRRIGFYRFDNTKVPLFPIYSARGQDGVLRETRYPKAGEVNPQVRIGIVTLGESSGEVESSPGIVWADFDPEQDQYFGTPFWSGDSRSLYVSRMPRVQNTLDLYKVDASDGSKQQVYHEEYPTWIDWMENVYFTESGLYMVRSFETGWEQIYFLSYDGKTFRRLTDGENWDVSVVRVDEKTGTVYFTAKRDERLRSVLYSVDNKGNIKHLTDLSLNVSWVRFSPDGRYFASSLSNSSVPTKICVSKTACPERTRTVADMAGESYSADKYALPVYMYMTTSDGFELPCAITFPKNFNSEEQYPVHLDIYGGPDTPVVRDRWVNPEKNAWWAENGIIQVVADCRAAGHNGRKGMDMVHLNLTEMPVRDFAQWADFLSSLTFVDGRRIGVEGFSFGGTMTAMLLMRHPDKFRCGVAGGGVYDWMLYDSHYTERFMSTPQLNPQGYASACVLDYVEGYPASYCGDVPVMLKLTHGTGDDNVHFQNTLQLIDKLQKCGKKFDFMIYPDGMHGYRGYQEDHFEAANREFWRYWLLTR